MEKEIVALDVDDVLFEFVKGVNLYYNEIKGTWFKFEDYTSSKLGKVWGCPEEEAIEVIHEFFKTPAFRNLKPLPYSQEVIMELKREKKFIALSYRPLEIEKITRELIGDYFFGMPSFCVGSYYFGASPLISKLEFCIKNGAKRIIEDNTKNASECGEGGISSILLTKPWNENVSTNSFKRVKNWLAVPRYLI
jgi:5'(3')-deoxyribonucleotidase